MIEENHSDVCGEDARFFTEGSGPALPLTRGQLEIYIEQKLNPDSPSSTSGPSSGSQEQPILGGWFR